MSVDTQESLKTIENRKIFFSPKEKHTIENLVDLLVCDSNVRKTLQCARKVINNSRFNYERSLSEFVDLYVALKVVEQATEFKATPYMISKEVSEDMRNFESYLKEKGVLQ